MITVISQLIRTERKRNQMKNFRTFLDNLEENVLLLMFALLVIVSFMQVVMRYLFQDSLSWSEEFSRYLFIWLTWMSTGYAVRKHRHLRIEVLSDFLGEQGKIILDILAMTVWCAFGLFLVSKGWTITSLLWRRGQITAALEIPMAITYASVPFGAAVMSMRLLDEIIASWHKLIRVRAKGA